jgi:hypothetical protein
LAIIIEKEENLFHFAGLRYDTSPFRQGIGPSYKKKKTPTHPLEIFKKYNNNIFERSNVVDEIKGIRHFLIAYILQLIPSHTRWLFGGLNKTNSSWPHPNKKKIYMIQ